MANHVKFRKVLCENINFYFPVHIVRKVDFSFCFILYIVVFYSVIPQIREMCMKSLVHPLVHSAVSSSSVSIWTLSTTLVIYMKKLLSSGRLKKV